MENNRKSSAGKERAKDSLHKQDLGETKDFNDLAFNEERNTFELDVKNEDTAYDHPLPYETASDNGSDFDSDYDEANPFVEKEYANEDQGLEEKLNDFGMHIDKLENQELTPEDELLAKTPEDDRDDLDEEGYPINDTPSQT